MVAVNEMRKTQHYHAVVTRPEFAQQLRLEIPQSTTGQFPMPSIQVFAKYDQIAFGWMFSDDRLLRDYLDGKISEVDLLAYGGARSMSDSA